MSSENAKGQSSRAIKLRPGKQRVVLHGKIHESDAEKAWVAALDEWGLDGTTQDVRDEILQSLAEIIVLQGTSVASDLERLSIVVDGRSLPLVKLASCVALYTNQDNPIRVFYRSFRECLIPRIAHGILLEPENTHHRATAILKYGAEGTTVQYAYDMFIDAGPYLGLTTFELKTGRALNAQFLRNVEDGIRQKSTATAPHDVSNRRGAVTAGADAPADSASRLGFSALR